MMRKLKRVTFASLSGAALTCLVLGQLFAGGQTRRAGGQQPAPTASEQQQRRTPPRQQPTTPTEPAPATPQTSSNPLTVAASPAQGSSVTQTILPEGGSISATAPDGTRFTLTIPKGTFSEPQAVTLAPVASIQRLPFTGGLVAAAQIAPEDVPLAKTPLLLIEPPKPIPAGEQSSLVSFAYNGGGQEFHLYPLETDPSRIALRLVGFGGYGVARGTEAEQEAVRQRLPTDPLDQVLMQMQKLNKVLRERLLTRASARSATGAEKWYVVNAALVRAGGQTGAPANAIDPVAYLSNLRNALREQYDRIVAKLKSLNFDCRSNLRLRVREAVREARAWERTVDLNGLLETVELSDLLPSEREAVVRSRLLSQGFIGPQLEHALSATNIYTDLTSLTDSEREMIETNRLRLRGLTDQEIGRLMSEGKAISEEVRKMYEALDDLVWATLRRGFEKAYQCCMCEPKPFHLDLMVGFWHDMTLISETRVLGVVDTAQLAACEDAISSKSAAPAGVWHGSITFKSTYKYKTSGERANNVSYESEEVSYEATLKLDGRKDANGAQIGHVSAQASQTSERGGHGTTACSRVNRQLTTITGSMEGETTGFSVSANNRAGEKYHVSFAMPEVRGNGMYSVDSEMKGACNNNFNRPLHQKTPIKDQSITIYGSSEDGEGVIDPKDPDTLYGSKSVTTPNSKGGEIQVTVTWNLSRCKAR